ncbi:hypothetical protein FJ970_30470 [Mesorhizobium sp. B2-1-8]|uniref:hypothetical protein n=1 Tax=Mesorhizobium sp. B2-1-8 TaxID=2589967 RepID=UPI00116F2369|nr:hypothetical protein [Mesorhizobium sp. B2-1-8]UCI19281.1 hypothetical protein FJ970_30470 [Mesorhizobium sp. B2-1-8]
MLPLIAEGVERDIHSVSKEIRLAPAFMAARAAGDEIALSHNTELTGPATNSTASNVGEPSCAVNGDIVLYTGNWYAAVSTDGGATFQYMDPESAFPLPSPNIRFCCDQVVQYVPELDMFVWLLQYGPESGDNIQRLAFAKSADVAKGRWKVFDITTSMLGVPGAFLDFPDLAIGQNYLYMTTNIFRANDVGSAVVRISLASIRVGSPTETHFVSMELQSFRVAQNTGNVGYFAAHQDTSTLAVFAWPENAAAPTKTQVAVARWLGGNGYISRTPDDRRWLDRADPRITGATRSGNELWFAWSVDARSNRRARPFIQIARIGLPGFALIDNVNVFDPNAATSYGALSTNADGEIGISYMIGGPQQFPSHVVGILTGSEKHLIVANGERSPIGDPSTGKGEWGDYLAVRPVHPGGKLFAATGYTMKGTGNGSNRDVTPRFVTFGRARNGVGGLGIPPVPSPPPPAPAIPPSGIDDLKAPFGDVNTLATVSTAVAIAIKTACAAEGQQAMPADQDMVVGLKMVTKPGVERWSIKTGTDRDVALVGKNVIGGKKLATGIVETTIEELNLIGRPADMRPPTSLFPNYQERRRGPVEFTVWRIECVVIGVKLEKDGDYHLVLQGASSKMMVGEVPTPRPPFIDAAAPWLQNIKDVRQAVDDKLIAPLSPHDFVQLNDTLVPRDAVSDDQFLLQPMALERLPVSFRTPLDEALEMPTFEAQVKPTAARITGVGFFDRIHGATGTSPLNGIELHPILKIEWL